MLGMWYLQELHLKNAEIRCQLENQVKELNRELAKWIWSRLAIDIFSLWCLDHSSLSHETRWDHQENKDMREEIQRPSPKTLQVKKCFRWEWISKEDWRAASEQGATLDTWGIVQTYSHIPCQGESSGNLILDQWLTAQFMRRGNSVRAQHTCISVLVGFIIKLVQIRDMWLILQW